MIRLAFRFSAVAGFSLIVISTIAAPAAATTTCSSVTACVFGVNSSTGPGAEGRSSNGNGVEGWTSYASTSASKAKAGVYGRDASTSRYNFGVFASSLNGTGIHGTTFSGTAISAAATGTTGTALSVTAPVSPLVVNLRGNNGAGISVSDSGNENFYNTNGIVSATVGSAMIASTGFGYGLEAYGNAEGSGILVKIDDNDGIDIDAGDAEYGLPLNITAGGGSMILAGGDSTTFDAESDGDLNISGHLTAMGGVDTSTARADGTRVATYSPRDAEPVVEDVGETRIVNGAANVALDPAFAATLDPTRPYYVFLTPEGDNRGLYVGTRTMRGFTIRESSSGRSALGVQYRIVGKPLGLRERRLAALDTSWRLRADRLRAAATLKRRQHIAGHNSLKRPSS